MTAGAASFGVVSVVLSVASGVEAISGNVEGVISCAVTDPLTVASVIINKRLIAEVVFKVVSDTVSTKLGTVAEVYAWPGKCGARLIMWAPWKSLSSAACGGPERLRLAVKVW